MTLRLAVALAILLPGVAWGQDGTLPPCPVPGGSCEVTVTATSTPPPGFSLPRVDTHDHVAEVMKPPANAVSPWFNNSTQAEVMKPPGTPEGATFTTCDTSAKDWSGVYNFSARSSAFSSTLVKTICHKEPTP